MKTGSTIHRSSVNAVHKALSAAQGPLGRIVPQKPLDSLVRTILSQNTTDLNSDAAFDRLRAKYPEWNEVMTAKPLALAAVIKRGGLANIKAGYIQGSLNAIKKREGSLSLARLKRLDDEEAMSYLTSLPGVGVKTAACVLLFAFGRPVMPVDTHISRITRRLGWIGSGVPTERAHELLEAIIPAKDIMPLHLRLIRHGRTICRPRNPACQTCPISNWCAFYKEVSPIRSGQKG